MSRYYLLIRAGDRRVEDLAGLELSDVDEADADALDHAGRLLANRITAIALVGATRIEIADETRTIFSVLSQDDTEA